MTRLGTSAPAMSLTLVSAAWMGGSHTEETLAAEPLIADGLATRDGVVLEAVEVSKGHREAGSPPAIRRHPLYRNPN